MMKRPKGRCKECKWVYLLFCPCFLVITNSFTTILPFYTQFSIFLTGKLYALYKNISLFMLSQLSYLFPFIASTQPAPTSIVPHTIVHVHGSFVYVLWGPFPYFPLLSLSFSTLVTVSLLFFSLFYCCSSTVGCISPPTPPHASHPHPPPLFVMYTPLFVMSMCPL